MRDFSRPGAYGPPADQLASWRRALVYRCRFERPSAFRCDEPHRIAVSLKQLVLPADEGAPFESLYSRVSRIADSRIAQLRSACGREPCASMQYRGWGSFGERHRAAAAFAAWMLGCPEHSEPPRCVQHEPTAGELAAPGGASPEQVAQFAPQNAGEIYNGADFDGSNDPDGGPMTLSYGELVPFAHITDFRPFVARAESMLPACAEALQRKESASTATPTVIQSAWYCVGPPNLVVVELRFRRESRDTLVASCSI